MSRTIISVDHGNSHIKTPSFAFASGLQDSKAKLPMATDTLFHNFTHYALTHERIAYLRDKTKDERFFILTLYAIAKELNIKGVYREGMSIALAVGLPPEHFARQEKRFENYFLKKGSDVQFTYNDTFYRLEIEKVYVFPQAYAAIASKPNLLKVYPRAYVIDIGGYTVDVLKIVNGQPDLTLCRSLDMGVITMTNNIRTYVNTNYELPVTEAHVMDVLNGNETVLPMEVKQVIIEKAEVHAQNIISQLRELNVNLSVDAAVFIGGGSLLLRRFFDRSRALAAAEYIPSVNANAIGYEKLAQMSEQYGGRHEK